MFEARIPIRLYSSLKSLQTLEISLTNDKPVRGYVRDLQFRNLYNENTLKGYSHTAGK